MDGLKNNNGEILSITFLDSTNESYINFDFNKLEEVSNDSSLDKSTDWNKQTLRLIIKPHKTRTR